MPSCRVADRRRTKASVTTNRAGRNTSSATVAAATAAQASIPNPASAGTELLGARLEIIDVPVRIWCPDCSAERELPGIQRFACPECGRLSGDIRAGRELDLESIELEPFDPTATEQTSTEQTATTPTSNEPELIQPQPLQQRDQP